MSDRITNSDFYFAVACFIQGSVLLSAYGLEQTRQDTWITAVSGFVISLFVVLLYSSLASRHRGRGLYDILPNVFGNTAGKILTALYLLVFLAIATFDLRDTGDFSIVYIMPEMSLFVMIGIFTLLCFFAVQSGIHNLLRYGFLLFFVTAVVILINTLLLLDRIQLQNFLPMFTLTPADYLHGTHFSLSVSFCEIIVFMTVIPFLSEPGKIKKGYIIGTILGFTTFITIILCEIAVLGSVAYILTSPYYETIRLINTFDVLTRLETLFAFMLIVMKFFKISLLYYAVSFGISKLLNIKMNIWTNLITGVALITLTMRVVDSGTELRNLGTTAYPYILSFFEIIVPLAALLLTFIKKRQHQ